MKLNHARPEFRKQPNGQLTKKCTQEAMDYKKTVKTKTVRSFMEVHSEARRAVQLKGGNTENNEEVLCEYRIQFGQYKGKSFKWLMENDLFYVIYVAASSTLPGEDAKPKNESSDKMKNRMALIEYASYFSEVQKEIEQKRENLLRDEKPSLAPNPKGPDLTSSLTAGLGSASVTHEGFVAKYRSATCTATVRPNLPAVSETQTSSATATCTQVTGDTRDDDQELCLLAKQIEENIEDQPKPKKRAAYKSIQIPKPADDLTSNMAQSSNNTPEDCPLFDGWRQTLPKADHVWISKALFKRNSKGEAELDYSRINKLWWDPPSPPLINKQLPRPEHYFARRLLLWMPKEMWRVRLVCPHDGCDDKELTSAGIYLKVRQVTDVDGYYNLSSESLECKNCNRKVIAWSPTIVSQLSLGKQVQFPVLLTYQNACDVRVITLMRERDLGKSSTELEKILLEQHSEKWMEQTLTYLKFCEYFTDAQKGLVNIPAIEEPPKFIQPPKAAWLLTVYAQDILKRMDHFKAAITSTFGRILKMNSAKKIVRKLAGKSADTAAWCTNVGNETGQVLMSVLTASEGAGLDPMASGLMKRYASAGVPPPEVLYVDRDCCGNKMQQMFSLWDGIVVRLDICHFMRRITSGCTTEAHQLYAYFCGRLSRCIFQWSQQDLDLLKLAKRSEMLKSGIINPTDDDVIKRITKRELGLHCRRQTRGVEETERLVYNLLKKLSGEQGCDTMGVPLLDSDRIWEIWESQKRHIPCLQDPEGVQLYIHTGILEKGGVFLPTYRCARGTTSLESFHKHIHRFMLGQSASDMHFQAYLLDRLVWWNEDRAVDADVFSDCRPKENLATYSSFLTKALNSLSQEVLGKKLRENVQDVGIYTGEQIGLEYLYSQSGKVLESNYLENEEEGQQQPEPLSIPFNPEQDDKGFVEVEDKTVGNAADVYLTSVNEKASEDN